MRPGLLRVLALAMGVAPSGPVVLDMRTANHGVAPRPREVVLTRSEAVSPATLTRQQRRKLARDAAKRVR